MEYFIIAIVALLASFLTLFSGFGLGTILTPAFILFFPVEIAIALTGIVHLLNNIFKVFLLGKNADRYVILRFGVPAIIGAFVGANLLFTLSDYQPLLKYHLFDNYYEITTIKLVVALMMITFATIEIMPKIKNLQFDTDKLIPGGLISGFFGGLSGHQGALRSAFLIKCGLSKESFIATGVIIACFVDFTRITIYFQNLLKTGITDNLSIVLVAAISAFAGAFIGKKLLKKITLKTIQLTVSVMIVILGVGLGSGII